MGYLAQQSLLHDPVEITEVIKQALDSKKRKLLTFSVEKFSENSEVKFQAKAARKLPASILAAPEEAIFKLGKTTLSLPSSRAK